MFDRVPFHTNQMLTDIANAFITSSTDQVILNTVYSILGLICCIIVLYIVWQRMGAWWRRTHGFGIMPVQERLNLLEQALMQRSRFDILFQSSSASHKIMSCSLISATADHITLEIPAGITPTKKWLGRQLTCFFRLARENNRIHFYTFTGHISTYHHSGNIHYIVLPLPEHIKLGQKRRHLRLNLPHADILDFRVLSVPEDGSMPTNPDASSWPPPLAVYRQERESALQIRDLSGGGLRLEYDPRLYPTLRDFIAHHPVLCMRLELRPEKDDQPIVYHLLARLRTRQEDFLSGNLMLGYEFVEYGSATEDNNLEWITIDPDQGIDDLVTWVFRRHLELYRERESE
ncbi:hypothetical protein MASR1M90_03940 [Desulfovibrionales bacterium]